MCSRCRTSLANPAMSAPATVPVPARLCCRSPAECRWLRLLAVWPPLLPAKLRHTEPTRPVPQPPVPHACRQHIISVLTPAVVHLSQHKFASNVMEKCLQYGEPADREVSSQLALACPRCLLLHAIAALACSAATICCTLTHFRT